VLPVDVYQVCPVELLTADESLGHSLSFLSVTVSAVNFSGPGVSREQD